MLALLEGISLGRALQESLPRQMRVSDFRVCNAVLTGEQLGKPLRALPAQQGRQMGKSLVVGTICEPWETERGMQQGAAGNL